MLLKRAPQPPQPETSDSLDRHASEARTSDLRFRLALVFRNEFIHGSEVSQCGPGVDTCPDWPLAYRLADLALGTPGLVSDDASYRKGWRAGYADALAKVIDELGGRLRDVRPL